MAKPPRKRVLSDHKKTGKKLVPPIPSLTGDRLQLTSWPRTGIPELVWLALLHDEDEESGVRVADTLSAASRKTDHKTPFCFASHFATLPEADAAAIWKNVPAADQAFLQLALQLLIAEYPTCPLKRLLPATTGPAHFPRLKPVRTSIVDQ